MSEERLYVVTVYDKGKKTPITIKAASSWEAGQRVAAGLASGRVIAIKREDD